MKIRIQKSRTDSEMLELVGDKNTLFAVVHEDFIQEDFFIRINLDKFGIAIVELSLSSID